MEARKTIAILVLALSLILCEAKLCEASPMGTAFTYQGYLYDANYPANDIYDFRFKLHDAMVGGGQVGSDVNMPDVDVIDGSFTVELNFGSDAFTGDARWLEIAVRIGDSNDRYTTLSPRQEVTPVPYAVYAETAGSIQGVISGSGTANYIAKFTDSDAVGNSVIYESASNVGIGTTSPSVKLEVGGTVNATAFVGDGSGLTGITMTETDPTVLASVKDGIHWSEVSSRPAGLDDGDDVGITSETDPTVLASVKDGIHWSEVSSRPAGLDDGDDVGITSESDTLDSVCSRGSSTSRSISVSNTVYSNKFYVSDAGNHNAVNVRNTSSSYPTIWARNEHSDGVNCISARNSSYGYPTIWAENEHSNGNNCIYAKNHSDRRPTLYAENTGSDYAGWFNGDLGCSGAKTATVETQSYGHRNLYTDESAEIYFFDRGQGALVNGRCTVNLDSMFLETVTINASYPMLVQMTLTADCKGVFVSEKTNNSFTVMELQGGTSNATFDWEVAAKRKGYEETRMEKITIIDEVSEETAGSGTEEATGQVKPPSRGVSIIKGE